MGSAELRRDGRSSAHDVRRYAQGAARGENVMKKIRIDELCDYIVENANRIYVRENVKGKWGSYALTELPAELAIQHALRFIKERRVPVVLIEGEESGD